jgi:hypothetical protein
MTDKTPQPDMAFCLLLKRDVSSGVCGDINQVWMGCLKSTEHDGMVITRQMTRPFCDACYQAGGYKPRGEGAPPPPTSGSNVSDPE